MLARLEQRAAPLAAAPASRIRHLLVVLPKTASPGDLARLPFTAALKAALARRRKKLADLAKAPVSTDLPNGGLASWVTFDPEQAAFERHTAMRKAVQALLAQREALAARIETCALAWSGPALKIRYHGDYHLGQVLLAKNDFIIIDFEGEPARPIAERARKDSPLRDVAGMMRSFDYARWTSLRGAEHPPEEHARYAALAAVWYDETRTAFLAAYAKATQSSGLYASFAEARALLDLFEIEKALYELRYEISNRPGWVQVPLQGILALLGADRAG